MIFRSLPRRARESLIQRDLGFNWLEMLPSEADCVADLLFDREGPRNAFAIEAGDHSDPDEAAFVAMMIKDERARKEAERRNWEKWVEKAMSRGEGATFHNLCRENADAQFERRSRKRRSRGKL